MSQARHHECGTDEQHDKNGDAQVAHGRTLRRMQANSNGPLLQSNGDTTRQRDGTAHAAEWESGHAASTIQVMTEHWSDPHRLGLSHWTVKHHLANARSKVGAATTAQLVWILAPQLPETEVFLPDQ
jgi:hypothetical protein